MRVQEKIKADLKTAMLEKKTNLRDILRVVIGEFNREGKVVEDAIALKIIKKMAQNAKDQNNDGEAVILNRYLPSQMDELEVKRVLMNYIMNLNSPTMRDMGKVMSYLKDNYGGQYDGKLASTIVRKLLA